MSPVDPRLEFADLTPGTGGGDVAEALDQQRVVIRAASERCATLADQAALFNLVNLASRLFAHVELDLDGQHAWQPLFRPGGTLADMLGDVRERVRLTPAASPGRDLVLAWGRETQPGGVAGEASGWTYAVGERYEALPPTPPASEGLAAVAASSFMIGQAFGKILAPLGVPFHPIPWVVSNLLDHTNGPAPDSPHLDGLRIGRALLLGAGSAGSSFVYAALLSGVTGGPVVAVDPDPFSERNWLRYPVLINACDDLKVESIAELAEAADLTVTPYATDIRGWLEASPDLPVEDLVLCSVDTVDGRRDATDVLARRTVNCGVRGMALHVANHGFGDEDGCAFCQYVDVEPTLSGAALLGQAIGLPPERVIAVQQSGGRLTHIDVQLIAAANVLRGPAPRIGDRLEDLRRRAYAQATITAGADSPVLVSAPQVSALSGLFMLSEAIKESTPDLRRFALRGRVDVDTSGQPPGFTCRHARDPTKRCLCWSGFRRRAWEEMHTAA